MQPRAGALSECSQRVLPESAPGKCSQRRPTACAAGLSVGSLHPCPRQTSKRMLLIPTLQATEMLRGLKNSGRGDSGTPWSHPPLLVQFRWSRTAGRGPECKRGFVCSHLFTCAHICSCLLMSAHICSHLSRVLTSVHVCSRLLTSAHVCSHVLASVHVCSHLFTSTHNCTSVHVCSCVLTSARVFHVCLRLFTSVHVCSHVLISVHMCSHLFTSAHICSFTSGLVLNTAPQGLCSEGDTSEQQSRDALMTKEVTKALHTQGRHVTLLWEAEELSRRGSGAPSSNGESAPALGLCSLTSKQDQLQRLPHRPSGDTRTCVQRRPAGLWPRRRAPSARARLPTPVRELDPTRRNQRPRVLQRGPQTAKEREASSKGERNCTMRPTAEPRPARRPHQRLHRWNIYGLSVLNPGRK